VDETSTIMYFRSVSFKRKTKRKEVEKNGHVRKEKMKGWESERVNKKNMR
jgi:hypothetical protein